MIQSPPAPAGAPDPAASREEVRRRFLAALGAGSGPPPDVEPFVAPLPEPERSELRAELEALRRSSRERAAPDATIDPGPDATTDHAPDAVPSPVATVDYAPASQGGTAIPLETDPGETADTDSMAKFLGLVGAVNPDPGETADYDPRASTKAEAPGRKSQRPDLPQSVAGYEVLGVLGRGAMGVVYKARQRGLKRLVALKMILSGDHASEQELARFRGEAEAVAHLQHPNIVQIYEVGEEQGRPFFSLEFVDGSSLDRKIAGTPLPPREAAALVQKLAGAMHYAHEHGIIHRDLKPSNVLLAQDGTPKIGDFGLAKRVEEDAGRTRPGTVLGTPSYMAPEQAAGLIGEVGPLSDQYSLGAILYELLTGRPPFKGSSILDTLQQVRTLEPVPPVEFQPGVPRDLETICLKCLQKDPARRYASALALAEDLRRFLAGEPILARPVGRAERLWRWGRRNPRVAALVAAVALLVACWAVSASALAWGLKRQTDEAKKQTVIAEENEGKANEQKAIATQKKKEAEASAEEAKKEKGIAQENEKKAKATAERTLAQMVNLGKALHTRLGGTRMALVAAPELRQLREQLLGLLRQSLVLLSQTIVGQGTTVYGKAAVCVPLGDLLLGLGQGQEAAKMYQEGYNAMKKLAQDNPDDDQTQANFAITILRLGDIPLEVDGDARTALDRYTRARDVDEAVLKRPGRTRAEWQSKADVSHAEVRRGWALLALGRPAEAGQCFEEARKFRQDWLDSQLTSWEASNYLMEVRLWLGVAAAHLGDEKAARQHFGEALRLGEDLMKRHPDIAGFKGDMAAVQGAYGDALLWFGKAAEAEKTFEESLRNLKVKIASDPDDIKQQPLLALAHERLGAVSAVLGRRPEAAKHYEEALRLRKALWEIEPANLVREAAYLLALARGGRRDEAAAGAAKLRPRAADRPLLLLDVARCYAACAACDTPKKREYTEQALAALKAAVAGKDYKDAFALQTDPDLEAVRAEPAFKTLIDEVKGR